MEKDYNDAAQYGSNSNPNHRITTTGARKMLGMVGRNYSDDDVAEILMVLYGIAEESYEAYLDSDSDAGE